MQKTEWKVLQSNDGVPTLEFEEGFLSWFRGYRFQVSGTLEGVGNNGSSASTLESDLCLSDNYSMKATKVTLLKHIIVASHIFESTSTFPIFWEKVFENDTILNQLLAETNDLDHRISTGDFELGYLLSYINRRSQLTIEDNSVIYAVATNSHSQNVGALVYLSDTSIALKPITTDNTEWAIIPIKELLGADFIGKDRQSLMLRLFYFLQLVTKITIDSRGGIKYLEGGDVAGEVATYSKLVSPSEIYDRVYDGPKKPKSDTMGSNIFG